MFCLIKNLFSRKACISSPGDKTVLIIEDDEGQRLTMQKILDRHGFRPLLAANGPEGLTLARQQRPDVILLDVVMPEMNGHEVCRQLKDNTQTKDIPVIFLTSVDTPQDVVEHFTIGADMHLSKPINAKELVHQIAITFDNAKKN